MNAFRVSNTRPIRIARLTLRELFRPVRLEQAQGLSRWHRRCWDLYATTLRHLPVVPGINKRKPSGHAQHAGPGIKRCSSGFDWCDSTLSVPRRRYGSAAAAVIAAMRRFMSVEYFEEQRREMVAAIRTITGHVAGQVGKTALDQRVLEAMPPVNQLSAYINSAICAGVSRFTTMNAPAAMHCRKRPRAGIAPRSW